MKTNNIVFIAQSIDGYIADKNDGIEWLETIPNPEQKDLGYLPLMERIDAIIMGRTTYELVCSFDMAWPYTKPVFVLSNTLKSIPDELIGKVEIVNGQISSVLRNVNNKGYTQLYIDGGATIHSFMEKDLIDELIITTIPVVLGGGIPLFRELSNPLEFKLIRSELYLNEIVQNHYKRKR